MQLGSPWTTNEDILARFPRGGLSYVFAYGSGVKQQLGYEAISRQKDNIIDIFFCVRDPLGWHAENIDRHVSHYSVLRRFGPRLITQYQEKVGAGVYFNTLVPLGDLKVTIKYGVISRDQMLEDLLKWRYLYSAGRLQKPVHDIVPPTDDPELKRALESNLQSAFQVALLLLPERFSAYDLFYTISSLSYKGDFRMIFGENKHKVHNIVQAQLDEFRELYRPAMKALSQYVAVDFGTNRANRANRGVERVVTQFEQDKSQKAKEHHLRNVPSELRRRILRNAAFRGNYADVIVNLAATGNLPEVVQISVNDIVWRSSILQSLKNIPSAGLMKSIAYSYRKMLKTFSK